MYLFTADLLWHTQIINVRTKAITTVESLTWTNRIMLYILEYFEWHDDYLPLGLRSEQKAQEDAFNIKQPLQEEAGEKIR